MAICVVKKMAVKLKGKFLSAFVNTLSERYSVRVSISSPEIYACYVKEMRGEGVQPVHTTALGKYFSKHFKENCSIKTIHGHRVYTFLPLELKSKLSQQAYYYEPEARLAQGLPHVHF